MGFNTGRKSNWSARANLAAVRKDMLTSPESTFATYGRDTFIRFASAVCERPRAFIRRINFLRNAEPILSIAFTPYSVTYLFRGVKRAATNVLTFKARRARRNRHVRSLCRRRHSVT